VVDSSRVLLEEFSHRVLNDYTRAISTLRLTANRVDDDLVRGAILAAAQSLQSHAEAHRALQFPWGSDRIDLGDHMQQICSAISAASLADAGIELTLARISLGVPAERGWRLGLIVAELITNAARHGLGWERGEIRVEMSATPAELCCVVADNGCSAITPTIGRGTRIISALAADFDGHIGWFFRERGVTAVVRAPLTPVRAPRNGTG